MTSHLSSFCDCLDKNEVNYTIEEGLVRAGFKLKTFHARMVIDIPEDGHFMVLIIPVPGLAPAEYMASAGEFVQRCNITLRVGNFELDHEDGEVRFRCGQLLAESANYDADYWLGICGLALRTADAFFPLWMRVCLGNLAASSAGEQFEAALGSEDDEETED